MDLMEAMKCRHSVRSYEDRALAVEARRELQELLARLNRESGLNMQLVLNEPKAFGGFMAHYGKFSGVRNYIALVGEKGPKLDETCGYCGEKLCCVIALGCGTTQGKEHPVKPVESLCRTEGPLPPWFRRGMEAAQLAPTAMNQQKFRFSLKDGVVSAQPGTGFYTKVDLGIAKCHFEIGTGQRRLGFARLGNLPDADGEAGKLLRAFSPTRR